MASASIALFGSSLPMSCSVKVSPRRLIAAAACAASWIPSAMSWQVTCAQLPPWRLGVLLPGRRCGRPRPDRGSGRWPRGWRERGGSVAARCPVGPAGPGRPRRRRRVPAQPAGRDGAGGRCPRRRSRHWRGGWWLRSVSGRRRRAGRRCAHRRGQPGQDGDRRLNVRPARAGGHDGVEKFREPLTPVLVIAGVRQAGELSRDRIGAGAAGEVAPWGRV
jgi:hypothetical protein